MLKIAQQLQTQDKTATEFWRELEITQPTYRRLRELYGSRRAEKA